MLHRRPRLTTTPQPGERTSASNQIRRRGQAHPMPVEQHRPQNNNNTHTSPDSRHPQKKISESLSDVRCDDLFSSLTTRHQAQLLSNSGDSFGFAAMPTCSELSLPNLVMHIAISRRLLLPITTCNCETRRCPVCHKNNPDPLGDHSLICNRDGNPA